MQQDLAVAQSQGWTVKADPAVRDGWPLAAEITLPSVTVTAEPTAFPGGLVWTANRVQARLPFTAPKTLHIAADGQQRLQLAGLPAIPFQADRMDLQAALDGSALPLLSIASLRAELPAGAVTVDRGTMVFPADGAVLDAHGVGVPGGIGRAFGATIGELHIRAALTRPVPAAPTPAAQARAWRDAGGRLDAPEFSLHWGPLDVSGHATGSLDAQLQPQGDGVLAVAGAPQALDALGRAGVLPPGTVTAVKAVLALLSAPAPSAPVRLPIQLRDGVLIVARFPLLRLPQLDWGPP